ncbi:MAG: methionine--tRNA ligase subunit beta [Candidatus Micrarchaeota archaeon]|nr:methionine--tRNA ligase subunit beta [Candidatus Micrarchaeota archaeon]
MEISYEEFSKTELRVATILSAEPVEGSGKLLKLTIDLGEAAPRTLAAGIAKNYEPAQLVGRQIIVVANLAPRSLKGVLSQGMLLAAESAEGAVVILMPDKPVPNGSQVK